MQRDRHYRFSVSNPSAILFQSIPNAVINENTFEIITTQYTYLIKEMQNWSGETNEEKQKQNSIL